VRRDVLLTTIFVLACCASTPAQFVNPDLKSGKTHVQSILLMPVQVQLNRVGMKGPEPMMEESLDTERAFVPLIVNILQGFGYKVDSEALAGAVLQKDTELRYTVDELQKRFDKELARMNEKAKDVRKGRFSLGDEVANLPPGDGVDALLFVRIRGQILTNKRKAFDVLVPSYGAFDLAFIRFGFVDTKTGDVLYFARPSVVGNIADDPDKAEKGIKKSLGNLCKVSPGRAKVEAQK
jgi:hypothetical protein